MKLIDADLLKKNLPEFRNPIHEGFEERNQGWNHCLDTIYDLIDEQPAINDWIPISVRLPKHEELALVSALSYNENKAFVDILKMSNGKWYVFEPFCGWEEVYCDITAWMPLPKPYKEGDYE